MSSTLVTIMKYNMKSKDGYISPHGNDSNKTIFEFDVYTFNKCIKVKSGNYNKWLCYWEGLPMAVLCEVTTEKTPTGFIKVVIISREVVPVLEVGEYTHSHNHYVKNDIKHSNKSIDSNASNIVRSKSSFKKKELYSEEEIEHYKKLIFGDN